MHLFHLFVFDFGICACVMVDNNVSVGNLAADFNKSMNFEMTSHPFFFFSLTIFLECELVCVCYVIVFPFMHFSRRHTKILT